MPNKRTKKHLQKANSVYDLPSTEEAVKWMHAVCGYPVKTTWLKAIKAGNFTGWPMITIRNVSKYYPETTKTPKGHLNQSRKNVRSTKTNPKPLEEADTNMLHGQKIRVVYTKVYDVMNTVSHIKQENYPRAYKEEINTS